MSHRSDLVDITALLLGETDKAIRIDGGHEAPVWLPKSQVEYERNGDGSTFTVTLPEWLAKEKGLI